MINVKKPRLLDSNLAEAGVLRPLGLQIQLQTPGVSTATMTLSPDDPEPEMHSWIELYNQNGSVGIFRVTSPTTDFSQQSTLTLRHGIDSLADSVLPVQEDFEGTPTQLLTRMLAAQTTLISGVAPWTLGSCAATNTIKLSLNYNRLSDLLANLEEELEGYFFEYDQSVFPWVINIVSAPSAVDGEFRLNRNVMTVNRTLSDNDLCTQLILSINSPITVGGVTTNRQYIKTYNNTSAQAVYGIVQKTADIDTSDNLTTTTEAPVPATPEADAWAARFLADHAAPTVQIQITGKELYRLTGDLWDESRLGHICRVALPKYNQAFTERVVNVTYPDALGQPDVVNISLANQLPKFSSTIALLRNETARLGRSGRISARNSADSKQLETWSKVVQYYGAALDGTGVLTLYESGIDMNPQGGVTIYSLEEGVQSLYSGIQVNTQAITLKVSKGDVSTQLELECGNVHITGTPGDANLEVDGYVLAADLATDIADIALLNVQELNATGDASITGDLSVYGDLSVALENTLTCGALSCGNLDCEGISINGAATVATNFIMSASVSGNVLTLTPYSGSAITFSKATTLSGSWGSGTYTVTADQNGATVATDFTALTNTGHWGVAANSENVNTYYYETKATRNGQATVYSTGNTFQIDAVGRYNAGYDTASGQVSLPGSGSSASFAFAYPKTTTSGGTTTRTQSLTSYVLESTAGSLTVAVTSGSGSSKVTHAQTTCIDSNLDAGNIKNGVTIFGVVGTYSGGGGDTSLTTYIANCQGSDASSYVQYSGASSVNSNVVKDADGVKGYVWMKGPNGWERTRYIPISHPQTTAGISYISHDRGTYSGYLRVTVHLDGGGTESYVSQPM